MRVQRCCRAVIGALLWLACAAAPQHDVPLTGEASFPPSGFLGDYSALRPGAGGRARLVFLDASVDFSAYERVIIDPVMVWKSDEARFAGISESEREQLARDFGAELERAFAESFVVREGNPGPDTLRLRVALTAAIAASGSADPRRLWYVESEVELLDALTNQRLAAAVDSKGTGAEPVRGDPEVVDAKAVFEAWAHRVAARLAALRDVDRSSP